MTIQLTIANTYGIAMASDRHVFRDGEPRSTGRDVKLYRLRTPVPAAMMASGPLAIFDVPVARLALPLARAITAAQAEGTPEALAQAVLDVFDQPLPGDAAACDAADVQVLGATAERVLEYALAAGGSAVGLERVLSEISSAAACRGEPALREAGRAVWTAHVPQLPDALGKPTLVSALRAAPELCGRAVVGALTHDWGKPSDLFVTVGMCCPATGVPVLVALRLWRGIGRRLHGMSRFATDYEALWRASRTVFVAQGSGRPVIEAMMDGVAEAHWQAMSQSGRGDIAPEMSARWDRVHDRLGISSVAELGALAAGLVRGGEAVGFLTRESEGTIAPVDCLVLTPDGVLGDGLPAGTEAVGRLTEVPA